MKEINIVFSNDDRIQDDKNIQHIISVNPPNSCFIATLANDMVVIAILSSEKYELDDIRMMAGDISRKIKQYKFKVGKINVENVFHTFDYYEKGELVTSFVEGWMLGDYNFDKYKTREKTEEVKLAFSDELGIESYINIGIKRAKATAFTRDLVNEIPKELNPSTFPAYMKEAFKQTKVDVNVLNEKDLSEMHGVLAVGQGSAHPAHFLELNYCGDQSKPLVALVGKGVTFDTGGVSLKVRRNISGMRMDMGGAAAVAGAVKLLSDTHAQVNVVGLIPVVENILDQRSYLPGDIITYKNNISVQIGNTDAEGRLILADGLIRASELGATYVVDIATLTSSARQALGSEIAGVFGDEKLANAIKSLGKENGDFAWPLPLNNSYEAYLRSAHADISNISSDPAPGAMIAALFLRYFITDARKWVHIDMAGVKERSKERGYYAQGASGYGARLLADYAEFISSTKQ